jgi:hypothetical protein
MKRRDLGIRDLPAGTVTSYTKERRAGRAIEFWERNLLDPYYVYLIQEDTGGAVKIGRARHPITRRDELQCGNPRLLLLRAVIVASAAAETALHRAYQDFRLNGEWFGDGIEDVLLTAGAHAMQQQIEWYAEGKPLEYVKEHAPTLIRKPNTVIEVAA